MSITVGARLSRPDRTWHMGWSGKGKALTLYETEEATAWFGRGEVVPEGWLAAPTAGASGGPPLWVVALFAVITLVVGYSFGLAFGGVLGLFTVTALAYSRGALPRNKHPWTLQSPPAS